MKSCNSVTTPVDKGVKLVKDPGTISVDSKLYKQIVGNLMYVTATRPDIMHGVSLISKYMEHSKELNLQTAKRILRYLCGTADFGLFYKKGDQTDLAGFTDSDYAGDLDDKKSTYGFVFMLGSGAISWSSKKQPIVTLSTTKAEYVAPTSCACQAIWLRRIMEELELNQHEATSIYCDNSSAIKLSRNPVLHGRSKHIHLRYHFLRNLLADCAVLIEQRAGMWKLLDFAELKRSSISFFDIEKHETAISRWLDIGEGKEVNLETCPKSKLQQQRIKHLGPRERIAYEVIVVDGKFLFKQTGKLLRTTGNTKWIFVLSTSETLNVGQKKKSTFQHSSFLPGGATIAAGRLVVEHGALKAGAEGGGQFGLTAVTIDLHQKISRISFHFLKSTTWILLMLSNYNYGPAGNAINYNLLNDPDAVATDATISFKTALWFWMTPQSPKPSCHDVITGQWTPSAIDTAAGRVPGYGVITNIINGGIECGKGQNAQVADRIGFYQRYCDLLKVGYGNNLDCYNQQPFA
ncbi:hypothetical protein SLEP1_g31860 [Rubroshorea leprosula]|uniref:Glycoside hydrolase family 19 catalytic domain-containing protein n=1 Tax=Rubroshorea leprosula TaxID=152421 RepID=A0AAV5KBJ0_9ROSI|nr:hypothetical protein SLEP1_g31860 [Rubroshorea leprosula]